MLTGAGVTYQRHREDTLFRDQFGPAVRYVMPIHASTHPTRLEYKNVFMMKNKFAVIFDFDGVIVDTYPVHSAAIKQLCLHYAIPISEETIRTKVFGRSNAEWLPFVFKRNLGAKEISELSDEKEAIFREKIIAMMRPVKGLIEFLDVLWNNGIHLAIASMAPRKNIDLILNKIKINDYFLSIIDVNSIDRKKGKPHPEIFLETARSIGYSPEYCVVFEDSLVGIEAAQRARCKVVAVATLHRSEELVNADQVISNFTEITFSELYGLFK